MDQHQTLLGVAGAAPDGWLIVARDALAAGDTGRVGELLAALGKAPTSPREHRFTPQPRGHEAADRALVNRIRNTATACWATMRDGTDRVYLVQADTGHAAIAGAAQRALLESGVDTPRVEVLGPGQPLPSYHERALLASTLLWSVLPGNSVHLARAFDGASAAGPWFAPDHELVVDPAIRWRLLDFLSGGEVVFAASPMTDVVTGSPGVVPADLRSDGTWVWSEASRYYLDRYRLAPDPGLTGHALANRPGDRLTPLTRHRVRAALNPIDQEGPSWRAG
ncbi:hypothetical protein BAY61_20775 [Prauserella marina]|uniref:Uncharacterized protein n=1 Tax=Prauserella marina TaxID=530584 RepID=A0A222VTG8_9PSEU|nr:hypothetical protein [Prauserella marina]ASR37011.1 hypothetical protein BAY61_20775 [Prauserella marina]PWV80014.1 hypothetical protein DES30_103100 [Prauserella marina]SDD85046.1 hypothetical protein SAMN05421630_113117 [Prauserella marina]